MKLNNFVKKHLNDDWELMVIQEARDIREDYLYLSEMLKRNKTVKFDFVPILTLDKSINGIFLRELFFKAIFWDHSVKNFERILYIYYITKEIYSNLSWSNLNVTDLIEWNDFLWNEYNIDVIDHMGNFLGHAWMCVELSKELNR